MHPSISGPIADAPQLSEADYGRAVLSIAATRTLPALGEALRREVGRTIGSRSFGFYALEGGVPRLLVSGGAPAGFLQDYDAIAGGGDRLVDQMCDKGHALDGRTAIGATWRKTGVFDLLQRWGYSQCMGGPLCVDGKAMGIVYTANSDQPQPFGPTSLQRMDLLCRAGSIALGHMLETGALASEPGAWRTAAETDRPAREADPLPRRAREVAGLVAKGATNKEIARALGLSVHTVKEYVGSLCRRLGAQNRTDLAHRLSERR